jgi:branched-chain amino acid transport system substrate-binding protein
MRKILVSLALILLVVGIAVVGCAKQAPSTAPEPAPAPPKMLDIGVVTPLTGPAAHLGTNMHNAVLMAIDDQNAEGGVTIAGQKYMLNPIIRDDKFDLLVGKSIAEELVYDKGVKVILGPLLTAVAVQSVTEPNKVILFCVTPLNMLMTGPKKPYTFFYSGPIPQMFNSGAAYIHEFYPGAKKVVTMIPDLPQAPQFLDVVQTTCKLYDFNWLGYEKFAFDTKDFMPVITRVLAKNPDIIDTNYTGGDLGALLALIYKQIREAGYKGIIWSPTPPNPGAVEEIVPVEYRAKIVTNDVDWEDPIVSDAYRNLMRRYVEKYNDTPVDIVAQLYNVAKPFFEFLDGQDTMDTTVWIEGFAKHHWQGIYGKEAWWIGKPLYGIDRMSFRANWASEYIDGNLETRWEPPVPYEMFTGTPGGHEVLLKAFPESEGKTVDVVVDQEVANVTPKMWTWWFSGNLERYYRLWLPANHYSAKLVMPPGSREAVVEIEEMIQPYYTQFSCHIIPGGIGGGARGLEFLTPDGEQMGSLTHDVEPTPDGIKIHSVFRFPAETPQAFLDAMDAHCKLEMQDLTRFLPGLYNEKMK